MGPISWWRGRRHLKSAMAIIARNAEDPSESPTYIAYGEKPDGDGEIGIAVLVDTHYETDGRLQLALEGVRAERRRGRILQ
jgi:hypothetical protein